MAKTLQKQPKNITFSFDDFRITSLNFSMNEDSVENKDVAVIPELSTSYTYFKEDKVLRVLLKVAQTSREVPYVFEIIAGGLFRFNESPPQKMIDSFARINCAAIIFPYVRETIADLTRRAGYPPLHLQPVNFVKFFAESSVKEVRTKPKTLASK